MLYLGLECSCLVSHLFLHMMPVPERFAPVLDTCRSDTGGVFLSARVPSQNPRGLKKNPGVIQHAEDCAVRVLIGAALSPQANATVSKVSSLKTKNKTGIHLE